MKLDAQKELQSEIRGCIDEAIRDDVMMWHPQAFDPVADAAEAVMMLLRMRGVIMDD